jgi:hypothetical protein
LMAKEKWFAVLGAVALTAAFVAVLSVDSEAAPPQPPVPCSIVLCPAPPPQCPPGFRLAIPAGQCCFLCVPSR